MSSSRKTSGSAAAAKSTIGNKRAASSSSKDENYATHSSNYRKKVPVSKDDDGRPKPPVRSKVPSDDEVFGKPIVVNFHNQACLDSLATQRTGWRMHGQSVLKSARFDEFPSDQATYLSVAAGPSHRAVVRYCDITGVVANYTDSQTKLHYADSSLFPLIRSLPGDVVQTYLARRQHTMALR
jgi:hypothetical protein